MTSNRLYLSLDLSLGEDVLIAIGSVSAQWATLEYYMARTTLGCLRKFQNEISPLFNKTAFLERREAFYESLKWSNVTPEIQETGIGLIDRIAQAENKRDTIIHGMASVSTTEGGEGLPAESWILIAREHPKHWFAERFTVGQIKAIADEIADINGDLLNLYFRLYEAVPGDYLAKLRQFEPRPRPFGDLQEKRGDPPQTLDHRIDDVLSAFMSPHIHNAMGLKLFLKDAKRAIAAYIGARETGYDRRKARKLLLETLSDLETTKRKLQKIAQWPELSNHLKFVYRDSTPTERPEPSSQKQVKKELQRIADLDRSYSDFAPDQLQLRLSRFETVVSLAAERATFGPGDAQRDQIAQDFADQLASAWRRATKTWPTCSRPTPRLKNPSPFALLLKTINQELLEAHHRSANGFIEYGVKSIKRVRQLIASDC